MYAIRSYYVAVRFPQSEPSSGLGARDYAGGGDPPYNGVDPFWGSRLTAGVKHNKEMNKMSDHAYPTPSEPIRSTMLPYGQQWLDEQDIEAVVEVLKSDFITQGPAIEAFEAKVALYVGAKYAVAFTNGTAALHGACFAAGIGEGDEVSYNFV